MFGILEKMDRFSNKLMGEEEKIDFLQELLDNNMLFEMHNKYIDAALFYMSQGKVVDLVLHRIDNGHTTDGPCFQECCTPTHADEDILGVGPIGYSNPANDWH